MEAKTQQTSYTTPVEFWLGLFLVLYSGGFLSLLLQLGAYGTPLTRIAAYVWILFGLALFVGGGLTFTKGLGQPSTRIALAAAALLYGARSLFGDFVVGNPFTAVAGVLPKVDVVLGLVADLALTAAAVWMLWTALRPSGDREGSFPRAALAVVGAVALQTGVLPFVGEFLRLAAVPGALSAVFASGTTLARQVPGLLKAVAGVVGLVAVAKAYRRGQVPGTAPWAAGLWALADVALLVILWLSWAAPRAIKPGLPIEIRTSLLIFLPALALLALAFALRPRGPRRKGEPGRD